MRDKVKKHLELPKTSILLSSIVALNDAVTPTLRQVWIDWDDREIVLYFIFDGKITDDMEDDAECVATEVIAYVPEFKLVDTKYIQIDYPKEIRPFGKICAYARYEPFVHASFDTHTDFSEIKASEIEEIYKRRMSVLLSCQQALLGSITPTMRNILVDWDEKTIWFHVIFDGPITEEMRNIVQQVEKKITFDFPPPDFSIHTKCSRIDFPERISLQAEQYVFSRKEILPD